MRLEFSPAANADLVEIASFNARDVGAVLSPNQTPGGG